ncbi:MAG: patatin-like phospholipase family protein [Betaproteobacteria bacterium]|nr:patatin-like phospholipase family protein [Betaproteobacteria bacterium]
MGDKSVVLPKRTVLVLQGGGALGAFQAGVFEAMNLSGLHPDWVIGTSIGSINAALIAGNWPERRMERLYEFWARVGQGCGISPEFAGDAPAAFIRQVSQLLTMTAGLPNFFTPHWGHGFHLGGTVTPEKASFYDVSPLRKTLEELVDFDYLNDSPTRISVGAVDVEEGQIRYFDSRHERIGVEHILASSALPPAFPAVEIGGRHYWDGGIHSNTPLEWMLRDSPRQHSLCIMATLWPIEDVIPTTLPDVLRRSKELHYASRSRTLIQLEQELHTLRHTVSLLGARLPPEQRAEADIAQAIDLGCRSVYHLIRLQAPRLARENHVKDIDFSVASIGQRWAAGQRHTLHALAAKPWETPVGPEQGVLVHDFSRLAAQSEALPA